MRNARNLIKGPGVLVASVAVAFFPLIIKPTPVFNFFWDVAINQFDQPNQFNQFSLNYFCLVNWFDEFNQVISLINLI